jgi:prephenate dehydrogenase
VEVPHTNLSKESRVVLVKQDAVVVLATGITATTRVLAVLANAAMTSTDMPTLFAVLPQPCGHLECAE